MARTNVLGDEQSAVTMVGLLIEKLGGSVDLTQQEVDSSLTVAGGTLYVEVDTLTNVIHLEVFPRGKAKPDRP